MLSPTKGEPSEAPPTGNIFLSHGIILQPSPSAANLASSLPSRLPPANHDALCRLLEPFARSCCHWRPPLVICSLPVMGMQAGPDLSVQGKNDQCDGGAGLAEFGGHFRTARIVVSSYFTCVDRLSSYEEYLGGKPVTSYVRAALTSEKKICLPSVCSSYVLFVCHQN